MPDFPYGRDYDDEPWVGPDGQVLDGGGAQVLDDIRTFLARFVVYPSQHELTAHVLWIAHTWLMPAWDSTPRIAFLSPEPGSGKSRALEVTEPLVLRPVHAVNTTPAYLFRKVSDDAGPPTILYDEIDTVFGPKAKDNEDIRGMLNAGHRKGATAGRCVVRGKIVETEELPAYCAVALAGLNDLPDTIMSRSIVVRMRRRAPGEPVEPWRLRVNGPDAKLLYYRLGRWAKSAIGRLTGDFWPAMPDGITDRDADVWEALLAVADLAGGHWPKTSRVAAVTVVTASRCRAPSIGVLLLRDVKVVFGDADVLPSTELINALVALPEAPWQTIRKGKPLDGRSLALRLSKYGIGSGAHRDGGNVFKGYSRAQFTDAWKRYLDDSVEGQPDSSVTSVTELQPQVNTLLDVTAPQTPSVTRLQESNDGDALTCTVTDVTDVTAKSGETPVKAANPEQNAAYINGVCVDCKAKPPSAGRPRCDGCHDEFVARRAAGVTS